MSGVTEMTGVGSEISANQFKAPDIKQTINTGSAFATVVEKTFNSSSTEQALTNLANLTPPDAVSEKFTTNTEWSKINEHAQASLETAKTNQMAERAFRGLTSPSDQPETPIPTPTADNILRFNLNGEEIKASADNEDAQEMKRLVDEGMTGSKAEIYNMALKNIAARKAEAANGNLQDGISTEQPVTPTQSENPKLTQNETTVTGTTQESQNGAAESGGNTAQEKGKPFQQAERPAEESNTEAAQPQEQSAELSELVVNGKATPEQFDEWKNNSQVEQPVSTQEQKPETWDDIVLKHYGEIAKEFEAAKKDPREARNATEIRRLAEQRAKDDFRTEFDKQNIEMRSIALNDERNQILARVREGKANPGDRARAEAINKELRSEIEHPDPAYIEAMRKLEYGEALTAEDRVAIDKSAERNLTHEQKQKNLEQEIDQVAVEMMEKFRNPDPDNPVTKEDLQHIQELMGKKKLLEQGFTDEQAIEAMKAARSGTMKNNEQATKKLDQMQGKIQELMQWWYEIMAIPSNVEALRKQREEVVKVANAKHTEAEKASTQEQKMQLKGQEYNLYMQINNINKAIAEQKFQVPVLEAKIQDQEQYVRRKVGVTSGWTAFGEWGGAKFGRIKALVGYGLPEKVIGLANYQFITS